MVTEQEEIRAVMAQERGMNLVRLFREHQELMSLDLFPVPQQGGTDSQCLIPRCPDEDQEAVHLLILFLTPGVGMGARTLY